MRRHRTQAAAAALALVLAGCGGSGGGADGGDASPATDRPSSAGAEATSPSTTAPEASPTTAPAAAPQGPAVAAEDFAFAPARLEVRAGAAVRWSNADGVAHTATAGPPDAPSGAFHVVLEPGAGGQAVFEQPGSYPYHCAIHPTMTGEVVVAP